MTYVSVITAVVVLGLTGCATLFGGDKDAGGSINITDMSEHQLEKIESQFVQGLSDYQHDGNSHKVEWFGCKGKKPKATIVLNHPDSLSFAADDFCNQWFANAFLGSGFDVLAVNRPGNGGSTGEVDFSGPQSVAAIKAAMTEAPKSAKFAKPITGMWGYSAGATAATLASRNSKLKFLILGGGFYDLEQTKEQSTSGNVKGMISRVMDSEGDEGVEFRSVGWDPSALPKKIIMYHGKNDRVSPQGQAATFRDSLASTEYQVTLQIIDGIAHEIPWVHHHKILKVMAAAAPD